jgi:DNA uptake protein ComE-like DNA-binding protein
MTLPKNVLIIAAVALVAGRAWADDAARTTAMRGLPISKVWQRTAPNERFLAPPALLRAGPSVVGLPTPFTNKLDVNRASLEQLQNLPGVGPAWGAKLMAGRPYRTVGDLARDGIPLGTIERIAPLIEFGP